MCNGQLSLPVGAQAFVGAAGTDAEFEHRVERAVGLLEVGGNKSFRQNIRCGARNGICGGSKEQTACGQQFKWRMAGQ
jgi:hypothetical protein